MIDSSLFNDLKFLPFNQSQEVFSDILPQFSSPKIIFKEYFDLVFRAIKLKNPVHIHLSYPTEVYFKQLLTTNNNLEYEYKRGLVIYLTQQKPVKYIGNVIRNNVFGWLEYFDMTLLHWNLDSLDRDYFGDFILKVVLEGLESMYFLRKGIQVVNLLNYSEEAEDLPTINQVIYKKIIRLEGTRFVFLERRAKGEGYEIIREIRFGDPGSPIYYPGTEDEWRRCEQKIYLSPDYFICVSIDLIERFSCPDGNCVDLPEVSYNYPENTPTYFEENNQQNTPQNTPYCVYWSSTNW